MDEPVWNHSTFSKNRDRLLAGEGAARFLGAILDQPRVRKLLSREHFSVDGTLIEAWASMKSFCPRQDGGRGGDTGGDGGNSRNASVDFRDERRANATDASRTDPDAMLYKKGRAWRRKLCFVGHGFMENRSGLIVDARLTRVSGHAERLAALEMIERFAEMPRAITLGADRGYGPPTSSRNCIPSMSARMLRRMSAAAARRSTGVPLAIPATRPASASASGSRRRWLYQGHRRPAQDQAARAGSE